MNQPLAVVLTIIPVARSIRIVLHWLPVATNEAIPSGASTSSTGRKAFTRLSLRHVASAIAHGQGDRSGQARGEKEGDQTEVGGEDDGDLNVDRWPELVGAIDFIVVVVISEQRTDDENQPMERKVKRGRMVQRSIGPGGVKCRDDQE